MKQINGTVTLSFLEEDNQQRVIFRVIPLCTREGNVFRARTVDFPDQGSLRIVPDKREQSTFKERMRTMGSLCAIQLCNEGKELAKVRQNRNYDPQQGESNQFAIYSDVICEFAEEAIFEVFEEGADACGALLPRVLIRRGMALYGPVARGQALDTAALKPFGNDQYLLHTVQMPDGAERIFYWNPEQIINWRQRRGTLRRGKTSTETAEGEPMAAASSHAEASDVQQQEIATYREDSAPAYVETHLTQEIPECAREGETQQMEAIHAPEDLAGRAAKPEGAIRAARAARKQEGEIGSAMPIGKRLSILDSSITFEEQIGRLDQPVSGEANLLGRTTVASLASLTQSGAARSSGTPLVRLGGKAQQPIRNAETVQYVVEQQIRSAHRERAQDYRHIENPIENLSTALADAWETPEIRQQAMETLADNEAFMTAFRKHLQAQGRELKAVKAAQEQLQDIEAERLGLLMQLETARNDCKRAMETLHAEMNHQRRAELATLENQLHAAREEMEKLNNTLSMQSAQLQQSTLELLTHAELQICACNGDAVAIAPVIGKRKSASEMVDAIFSAMNRQGFACHEDDAIELLLHFALNDEFCIGGESLPIAELCARVILDALGLVNVSARTYEHTLLNVASLLPVNGLRTPTVEVAPLGRAKVGCYGHKTIRLLDRNAPMRQDVQLPVVYAPPFRGNLIDWKPMEPSLPTSLESFTLLREEAKPLWEAGEAWFNELDRTLREHRSALHGIATQQMRTFVSTAACRLRGGFLAAADAAVLSWVVPAIYRQEIEMDALRQTLAELPRCLTALGLR